MSNSGSVVRIRLRDGRTVDDSSYADIANTVMEKWQKKDKHLTTTKLRSIYGQIVNVYTKINVPSDYERYLSDLQYLKVKMAYEAGREDSVKRFLEHTGLMEALDCVKNYDQFMLYCRYAESLVAYFKFYGGKDN